MTSFTNYLASGLLEQAFGAVDYSASGNHFVALGTGSNPTEGGAGLNEPTGEGYNRVTVVNDQTAWSTPIDTGNGNMSIHNRNTITFPTASGAWGDITVFGVFDATGVSNGNLLGWGTITPNQSIDQNNTASFASGSLSVSLD